MPAMPLDPEIAEFLRLLTLAWQQHPSLAEMPIVEARADAEQVRAPWRAGGPTMASTHGEVLTLPQGPLRVWVYRPHGLAPDPAHALLYLTWRWARFLQHRHARPAHA